MDNRDREFYRGILFGILLSGIALLTVLLVRYGTFGASRRSDASVLTSGATGKKLQEVQEIIDETYLYEVSGEDLETWMFKGIAAGLDDTYASYYSPKEMEAVMEENEGTYYGLGIAFSKDEQTEELTILSVYPDSPAMQSGLMEGDVLLEVNGEDITALEAQEVSDKIGDLEEDSVNLTISREGEKQTITVSFDTVTISPVTWELLESGIGYIVLTRFTQAAAEQFTQAIDELLSSGMEGLIVDVRNNPGGLLDSVTAMLDEILPEGVMVSTQTREGRGREIRSDKNRRYDGAVAVLVNGDSASASEVFAGAVQDYALGPVVGTTTFGKGVVQRTYPLRDGSALKLTTEKYFTPLGRDIDGSGITPDVQVEEEEEQLAQAEQALLDGWGTK